MRVLYYAFLFCFFLYTSALILPSITYAQDDHPVVFSDDFSSGNLDKWQDIRPNPNAVWSVVDGWAEGLIKKSSTLGELVPKDEYWDERWHDIIYELDYVPLQGVDRNISFHFQDTLNWYEIHFVGNGYEMARVKNGEVVWLVSRGYSVADGEQVHLKIQILGPEVTIMLNQWEIAKDIDPTFNQNYGKIGLKIGAGNVSPTRVRFDNVKVTLLNDIPSPSPINPSPTPAPSPEPTVPPIPATPDHLITIPFKQTDPLWSSSEYDSAAIWARPEPTDIKRWGCAVTSLAMIFNYHGLSQLPDGKTLNPGTLNTWLKSQPDGYIGEGLLNWAAAMRLTKHISAVYNTPKLEYSKIATSTSDQTGSITHIANEILSNQPVILQIPGHFLVGDGIVADTGTDIFISDPYYNFAKFSQHQKPLQSIRTFRPSFTDLSYMVIATDPSVQVSISDHLGNEIAATTKTTEYLEIDQDEIGSVGKQSSPASLIELAKPETGTYQIKLTSDHLKKRDITIFAYDTQGEVSVLSKSLFVGLHPLVLETSYQKADASSISIRYMFDDLIADTVLLEKDFAKKYAYRTLLHTLQSAKQHPDLKQQHVRMFNHYLDWYKNVFIDDKTVQFDFLKERLSMI